MPKKNSNFKIEDIVRGLDLPHLREKNGSWLQTGVAPAYKPGFSFDRLCHYAGELRKRGMLDGEIACMLMDLYWDAVTEYTLNRKAIGPIVLVPPPPRSLPPSN